MAKPKLALIPAAQGTSLYSVLPSSGVGDFQFNRSGSATRISAQGLIETVASGVSRLNYPMIDGVVKGCPHHILEPQRTNQIAYSEDFSNSAWNKINGLTVQLSDVNSPDGTLTNSKIIVGSNTGDFGIYDDVSALSGSQYIISIFAKKGSTKYIRLREGYSSSQIVVNLENGVVVSDINASDINIENYGNDWYRLSYKFTAASTAQVVCYIHDNENNSSYTGNGQYLYVYGASIEQGSYPTSYIKTTSAAVTRSAETANGSGDAATFNDSEGVLMVETTFKQLTHNNLISLTNGQVGNIVQVYANTNDKNKLFIYLSFDGQVIAASSLVEINDIEEYNKISIKYKSGSTKVYINGFLKLNRPTAFTGAIFDRLHLSQYNETLPFVGSVKQIQYFDTADIDLEKLTSWVSFQEMAEGQLYTIE
jgi:hypothetical protein